MGEAGHVRDTTCMKRSKDNLQKSVPVPPCGFWDPTLIVRVSSKCLYLISLAQGRGLCVHSLIIGVSVEPGGGRTRL